MGAAAGIARTATGKKDEPHVNEDKNQNLVFESLGLARNHIEEFAQLFWRDRDRVGSVSFDQLVSEHNFTSLWMGKLLFKSIELCMWQDVDDLIPFQAFVVAVWNLCTSSPAMLADMFFWYIRTIGRDHLHIGHRSFNYFEVENFVRAEFGAKSFDAKQLREILTLLPYDDTGFITRTEFLAATTVPDSEVLTPLLNFQQQLQKNILAPTIWTLLTSHRASSYGDQKIWDIVPGICAWKQPASTICVRSIDMKQLQAHLALDATSGVSSAMSTARTSWLLPSHTFQKRGESMKVHDHDDRNSDVDIVSESCAVAIRAGSDGVLSVNQELPHGNGNAGI